MTEDTSSVVSFTPPVCYTPTPSALRTSSSLAWEALALWCMPTVSCIHPTRLPRTSSVTTGHGTTALTTT